MKFQESLLNKNYKFEVLDSDGRIVGNAHIEFKHDRKGKFWHLEDLLINPETRCQGYGTGLLKYLCDYLWKVDRLRIRVHPGRGLQITENQADDYQRKLQQYSEEELDAMDYNELQKSDFWTNQKKMSKTTNSEDLIKWYEERGFTHKDTDGKHLWLLPSEKSQIKVNI